MVKSEIKTVIQEAYRQYLKARDIKPRSGQRHMIAEIARYLSAIELDGDFGRTSASGACIIEAGTGTGKTLAYLISTLPFASALKKNIVISTATVTLQQQIIERELPLLKSHTGLEFDVALAKGRGRYLCLHKVDLNLQEKQQASLPLGGAEFLPGYGGASFSAEMYQQFLGWMFDDGWKGDLDSLPEPVDEDLWRQVTTDHRQCLNKRCGFLSQCPYYRNKAEVDQAELIVANHDLVFADLNLGGGFILPSPEQTIYIFDEGHHIADKALSHFAFNAGLKSTQKLLKVMSKVMADGRQSAWAGDVPVKARLAPLTALSVECQDILENINRYFWKTIHWNTDSDQQTSAYRFPMGILPELLLEHASHCASKTKELVSELDGLVKSLRESVDKERQGAAARQLAEQVLLQFTGYQNQLENLNAVWQQMNQRTEDESIPTARWLTTFGENTDSDITVHVSPTNVAQQLQSRLWERAFAVIMTSATMSVAGSFQRLNAQAGLPEKSVYSIHASPFNFTENCTLQLCDIGIEPSDREQYLQPLTSAIEQLVNPAEATLVLFSSKRHMKYVADVFTAKVAKNFLRVQGADNKSKLLEEHRLRVDQGKGSLVFGLASFAEGLDLPGKYLTHVIIAKLPFSVPDDPVEATYAEWLKSKGGSPFKQVAIPDATTRLLQACGRLLRSEQDVGKISVCDRRLWTKSYGNLILQALPPYRREWIRLVKDTSTN